MDANQFFTIESPCTAELREKASKFYGYAYPIENEAQGQAYADLLWKEHNKATHVCYAFKIGIDDQLFRINDDGEPSGTAGKPIYGQILSKQLTDVGVYVVRYYGGTKLGASGLIAAYKDTAKLTLDHATIITKSLHQCYELTFSYDQMGKVLNDLKHLNVHIADKKFDADAIVQIAIPLSEATETIRRIKARLLDFSLDRIEEETMVDFCTFVKKEVIKI